jgi:hypothetical protein
MTLPHAVMMRRGMGLGLLLVMAAFASGCDAFLCEDRGAIVEKVKKLDPAYFEQLYAYAASGQCHVQCRPPVLSRLSGLGNRSPVLEMLPRNQARIKLSVCMDHGVALSFTEIGTPQAAIYVSWSVEFPDWDRALLWSAQPAHARK